MAAMIWDEQAQAFTESETPMKYDPTAESWTGTTGLAWDNEAQAWTEKWGTQVSAYVYGAVSETVTIRKNGIIVETVQTDSSGRSTEMVSLAPGTYDMTGSVSGWTEEQVIDSSTTKFRAMPEGSLYWYGNTMNEITGGYRHYSVRNYALEEAIVEKTNYLYGKIAQYQKEDFYGTVNTLNLTNYTKARWIYSDADLNISCSALIKSDASAYAWNVSADTSQPADISQVSRNAVKCGLSIRQQNSTVKCYAMWYE